MPSATTDLFGGSITWRTSDWVASDDTVRGGRSQSYFETANGSSGHFYGTLDYETLGGAGFASQRTTGEDRSWDLSAYSGIELWIDNADGKKYTITLKDSLLPPDPETGRDQATTSWEHDFDSPPPPVVGQPSSGHAKIRIPWSSFLPTYRGREQKDAKPLDLSSIKRISIMMRSFFGAQYGDFSITIRSIAAYLPEKAANATVVPRMKMKRDVYLSPDGPAPARHRWSIATASVAAFTAVLAVFVVYSRYANRNKDPSSLA